MENKKKKIALFGSCVLLCLFLVIGVSYAIWQIVLQQTNENVVTTGCFKINFTEKNDINLNNAYPILDEAGKKLTPYEFTLENTCDSIASYQVNLEILDTTTLEKLEYIKVMFDEKAPRILTKYNEVQKTLDNATTSYKLDLGFLEGNTSKTFTLRLWMDEDTPPVEEAMNKIFKSKVTVSASYKAPVDTTNMIKQASDEEGNFLFDYSFLNTNSKVIFQSIVNPIEGVTPIDISFNEDNSVLAYFETEDDVTYIQADGKIKFPENSMALFANLSVTEINGLENVDTSQVTIMSGMFADCSSLISLDLSSFDVSEVVFMNEMFLSCDSLLTLNVSGWNLLQNPNKEDMFKGTIKELNVSNWNTSEVTNMSGLFSGLEITTLDLSSFDTSNVTNMTGMFSGCRSLTSLDVSQFDTTNVTNMSRMFSGCSSLTSLDVSSFITKNLTNASSMFEGCSGLMNLDLSRWDTSNIINMSGMFFCCSGLTSLNVRSFDTQKVTDMMQMFSNCSSLSNLDLNSFNTQNVTNMFGMFSGCSSLTDLDLSKFNTLKVIDMSGMFFDNTNLTNIIYGDNFVYKSGAITTNMFTNCPANRPTHSSWEGVTFS